jgi:hypothetical protein
MRQQDVPRIELKQVVLISAHFQQLSGQIRDRLRVVSIIKESLDDSYPGQSYRFMITGEIAPAAVVPLDAVANPPGRLILWVTLQVPEGHDAVLPVGPFGSRERTILKRSDESFDLGIGRHRSGAFARLNHPGHRDGPSRDAVLARGFDRMLSDPSSAAPGARTIVMDTSQAIPVR